MRIYLFLISACILLAGCSTQKNIPNKNAFTFSLGEDQFEIISINTNSGEGTNYLSQINRDGQTSFTARDIDQDGTIDIIQKGEIDIQEADIIYKEGIDLTRLSGNYKERISLRTFEFRTKEMVYTIKSYVLSAEAFNNVFVVFNLKTQEKIILLDHNADGVLDSIQKGAVSLEYANQLYKKALEEGANAKKIISKNGRFYVLEDTPALETAANINY